MVLSISKSNFAWNSLQKSTILPMLRRKNTLNEGGGQQKVTLGDMGGGGGSKISKKGGRPL